MSVIDDANAQITDRALMELYRRLEPFIRAALKGIGGGDSTDAVKFNNANDSLPSRYLTATANDTDANGDTLALIAHPDDGLGGGTGNVRLGFPTDDTDESLVGLVGDVVIGAAYDGPRAIYLRVTAGAGDGTYRQVAIVADEGIDFSHGTAGKLTALQLVILAAGTSLNFFKSDLTTNIMRLDPDGTLHLKAGASVVADL